MNKLIAYLTAIQGYSKDIHYSAHGNAFYSKHILADLIVEPLSSYIDDIKEVCLLGKLPEGERPLVTKEYDAMAKPLYPDLEVNNDKNNFKHLQDLIVDTLKHIDKLNNLSKGEENLIGAIAEHLQKINGLLNLQNES